MHTVSPLGVPAFDAAWKDALTHWLPDGLRLFWPPLHRQIDWRHAPVPLSKELRRLTGPRQPQAQRVDHLVELRLCNGQAALLLLHVEVQVGQVGKVFVQRMFQYHVVLQQRYPDHVHLSCAILLDHLGGKTRMVYRPRMLGSRLRFSFPVVSLESWRRRMAELEGLAPHHPFAVVLLAQLQARAGPANETRLLGKLALARSLRVWGYGTHDRLKLFRVLDLLLVLPEVLEDRFYDALEQSEDEEIMQQLTGIQRAYLRRVQKEERQEGKLEGAAILLQALIQQKFGSVPEWAGVRLAQADTATLQQWALNVLHAERLEAVFGE